jgi:hypothetical protein
VPYVISSHIQVAGGELSLNLFYENFRQSEVEANEIKVQRQHKNPDLDRINPCQTVT